jgi:two-component system, OmpR family, KDP operon response regulator KdpE
VTELEQPAEPGPLVLVIEDDVQVRRMLRVGLTAHGFRLLEATTGQEGLTFAAQYGPEIVLLDLGLPDLEGFEVTQRLREWSSVPIVVLSARSQEAEKVRVLDAGADDYLTKPFSFPELLARLRVSLRHAARLRAGQEESVFESGPLRVDLGRRVVQVNGEVVRLTPIEYKLLSTLVQHAGRVVTQRQLLGAVWGPRRDTQTQYLRVYMTHLRRKLEPDPLRPQLFETEAGVGYRLRIATDAAGPA